MPDIDIDFLDREQILNKIKHVPALMKDGRKHNTGVYCHTIPINPLTGLASIDYETAETRGYFKIDQKEKQLLENKKQTQSLIKEERKNKISKIKQISESISQEVASTKLITKYPGAKLVGKTNKHNLVFEMDNKQLRVNTKGEIL